MPVPRRTGSEEVTAKVEEVVEKIMIRYGNQSRQQPHEHTDKV